MTSVSSLPLVLGYASVFIQQSKKDKDRNGKSSDFPAEQYISFKKSHEKLYDAGFETSLGYTGLKINNQTTTKTQLYL